MLRNSAANCELASILRTRTLRSFHLNEKQRSEMRVRFYEVGPTAIGVIYRIDEFPVGLAVDPAGSLQTKSSGDPAECELEDIGGQIMLRAIGDCDVAVNDTLIESSPLLPGDKFRVGEKLFRVSYERTAKIQPPSMRVRILN